MTTPVPTHAQARRTPGLRVWMSRLALALVGLAALVPGPGRAGASTLPSAPSATWLSASSGGGSSVPWPGGLNVAAGATVGFVGQSYAIGTNAGDRIASVELVVHSVDADRYLEGNAKFGTQAHVFRVTIPAAANSRVTVPGGTVWRASWTWKPPGQPWARSGPMTVSATSVDRDGDREAAPTVYALALGRPSGARLLTLSFGRSTWSQYQDTSCSTPIGGASTDPSGTATSGAVMTLGQVAASMSALDPRLFGVGNVVVNRTLETGRACVAKIAHSGWPDLAMLKTQYHWKFVSAGMVYADLGAVAPADWNSPIADKSSTGTFPLAASMQDEICGSAHALAIHAPGFPEANGLFAYPNDSYTDDLQSTFTAPCYAFGRTYRGQTQARGVQVLDAADAPPATPLWYERTVDITGGACVDELPAQAGLPLGSGTTCTGHPPPPDPSAEIPVCEARVQHTTVRALTYPDIGCLTTMVQTLQPGEWLNLQAYRFVTGAYFTNSGPSWDCRDADWRRHWTNQGELMCWTDYAAVLAAIPNQVTITDPRAAAAAMGRTPPPIPPA